MLVACRGVLVARGCSSGACGGLYGDLSLSMWCIGGDGQGCLQPPCKVTFITGVRFPSVPSLAECLPLFFFA